MSKNAACWAIPPRGEAEGEPRPVPAHAFANLKTLRVYYAHPITWYDTKTESDDMTWLRAIFAEVHNPNNEEFQIRVFPAKARGEPIMDVFTDFIMAGPVDAVDAVVYRTFRDQRLSSGVALELFTAFVLGKEVFRLDGNVCRGLTLVPVTAVEAMRDLITVAETQQRTRKGEM